MRKYMEDLEKLVGKDHPSTCMALLDLADALFKDKQYDECEALYLQVCRSMQMSWQQSSCTSPMFLRTRTQERPAVIRLRPSRCTADKGIEHAEFRYQLYRVYQDLAL